MREEHVCVYPFVTLIILFAVSGSLQPLFLIIFLLLNLSALLVVFQYFKFVDFLLLTMQIYLVPPVSF